MAGQCSTLLLSLLCFPQRGCYVPCHLLLCRGSFNVYSCGSSGPVVLCIHGGGYTGLTWSLVAEKLKDK